MAQRVGTHRRKKPSESMIQSRAKSLSYDRSVMRVRERDDTLQLANGPQFEPTDHVPEFRKAGVERTYVDRPRWARKIR